MTLPKPIPQCVLCVDPDVEVHALLAELLRDHHPKFVGNAFEAVRELHSAAYDAFIIEQRLPDWSGTQLAKQIRRTDPNSPILFYTGAAGLRDRERALSAGASAYLSKPVDPQRLRNELRVLIELASIESISARAAATQAAEAELARYAFKAREAPATSLARLAERTARLKAARAFLSSGGTRANFERWWPSVFAAALAHYPLFKNWPLFW
jgi:DNA-binding response OmpR family regulator